MRRRAPLLLAALLLPLFAALAAADVLVLKDGRRIEGTILSESDAAVRIRTRLGELRFERSKIASIERGKTRKQEFDERWKKAAQADEFHDLGLWAAEEGLRTEARRCMQRAVKLDPQHAGANTWLGNVEYEGEWMTPEERDRRMAADREAEMAARGLVLHEGRWITPEEKDKLERGLVLHDGRWMPFAEAQRARGLEQHDGRWMPRPEALARRDAARAAERAGVPFQAFVGAEAIVAGPLPEAALQEIAGGLEVGRGWFDGLYGSAPGLALLGERLAEFYVFGVDPAPYKATTELFASWTKTVPDGWAEAVARVHGFLWWDPFPLSSARRWHREDYDLTGHCYHHWGHLLLNRLGYDGRLLPPWYDESFAALMEVRVHGRNAVFCRATAEPGQGTSATAATFSYDPKLLREGKWRQVLKAALEARRVRAIDKLAQLEFSELELIDVATGMGILEWLQSLPPPAPDAAQAAGGAEPAAGAGADAGPPAPAPSALAVFHARLRAGAPEVPLRVVREAAVRQRIYDEAFRAAAGTTLRGADAAWRAWFLAR